MGRSQRGPWAPVWCRAYLHSSVPVPNGGICSLSLFLESTRRFPNSSRVAQPLCFKTLHVFVSHLKVD